MAGQTLLIDGFDLETIAGITNWDGLLDVGPPKGDLLTFDFAGGAVWVPANEFDAYTIVVPIVMRATPEDAALADLLTLDDYLGVEVTLTRRAMLGGALVDHTCQAVMTSRPTAWDLDVLGRVPVTLTFQALTGWVQMAGQ
jgi:hypothetical protein